MRARALLAVAALLWPVLSAGQAVAQTQDLDVTASASIVTYGEPVTVSVALAGAAECLGDRAVALQWRPADSTGFATVAQATTAADGSAAFEQTQAHTGRFRASVPPQGPCPAITSAEVPVRVRARVDASLVVVSPEAGDCVDLSVIVTPAKPGQTVELQQRRGSWRTREILTLDPAGTALAHPCLDWDDIGIVRLRVRWNAQDELNETGTSPVLVFEVTEAGWMREIDDLVAGRAVSVAVGEDHRFLYRHADRQPRIPASNEKLLLAMALLDTFGPEARISTRAAAPDVNQGVIRGDLWILGRGDPRVGRATVVALARRIADAGVTRIAGRVMGSTKYFRRDWDAPGWNSVARRYVNRPTALTFEGNRASRPEREAAAALTERLEELGIRVAGRPGSGAPPSGLSELASVRSKPLSRLLTRMLRPSDNFAAEVLGKRLGAQVLGPPGTIAKGAEAIGAWTMDHGVGFVVNDASGLSYDDRVTAEGLVRLLWEAEASDWGGDLRRALPSGGQGTLRDRLARVRLRAKTGSLTGVSALSGWVYVAGSGPWIEFSILCSGMSKSTAVAIEDRIVKILRARLG